MMAIKQVILFVVGLFLWNNNPQQPEALFKEANALYQQEKYNEALAKYQEIEAYQLFSDELFYNMGNVHYKLNQIAPAIYYYEKVLKQNPLHRDAKFNLAFAQQMAIDHIEPLPKNLYQKFRDGFILKLSYNTWAWIAVSLALLFGLLFLLYHFALRSGYKRLYFISSMVCVALALMSIGLAYQNHRYVGAIQYAIVFNQLSEVKSAPSVAGEPAFELHEGAKVRVLESLDNWKKVQIADGREGWIVSEDIKEL